MGGHSRYARLVDLGRTATLFLSECQQSGRGAARTQFSFDTLPKRPPNGGDAISISPVPRARALGQGAATNAPPRLPRGRLQPGGHRRIARSRTPPPPLSPGALLGLGSASKVTESSMCSGPSTTTGNCVWLSVVPTEGSGSSVHSGSRVEAVVALTRCTGFPVASGTCTESSATRTDNSEFSITQERPTSPTHCVCGEARQASNGADSFGADSARPISCQTPRVSKCCRRVLPAMYCVSKSAGFAVPTTFAQKEATLTQLLLHPELANR